MTVKEIGKWVHKLNNLASKACMVVELEQCTKYSRILGERCEYHQEYRLI